VKIRLVSFALVVGALFVLGVGDALASLRSTPYTTLRIEAPDPAPNAEFGYRMRATGDINGDGVPDFFVSAPTLNSGAGRVYLLSGKNGSVIYRLDSPEPQAGAQFGFYIEVLGKANHGTPNIAVGSQFENVDGATGAACTAGQPGCNVKQGKVWVFNGKNGKLLYSINDPFPQGAARFGARIGVAGDIARDGVPDLIVGAQGNDVPAGCSAGSPMPAGCAKHQGQAFIFDGADGHLLRTLNVPAEDLPLCNTNCSFGGSVQSPGDTNGDGIPDQLVSAFGYNNDQGRMYVFDGKTGALRLKIDDPSPQGGGPDAGALFGFQDASPFSPGAVDSSGAANIYGNGFTQNGPAGQGQGEAWVFDGLTGKVRYVLNDPTPTGGGQFGFSETTTDYNKDGTPDLYIGQSPHHVPGANEDGGSYVLDGKTGKLLKAFELPPGDSQPSTPTNGGPRLGWDVAAPGDLNHDGQPDYIASATYIDVGANMDQGRVYVFLSHDRTKPAKPTVHGQRRTHSSRPLYRFAARDADNPLRELSFRCSLDSRHLHRCFRTFGRRLKPGRHILRVQALDIAKNRSRVKAILITVLK